MKYLIKYSAYTDHGNGCCVCDFEKIEDDLESLCRSIASLESDNKDDKYFKYCIYELHDCDNKLVTDNEIYLNLKKKLEQENVVRNLKQQMGYKRTQISDQERTKDKYGKWDNYDEQLDLKKKELEELRTELTIEEQKLKELEEHD